MNQSAAIASSEEQFEFYWWINSEKRTREVEELAKNCFPQK